MNRGRLFLTRIAVFSLVFIFSEQLMADHKGHHHTGRLANQVSPEVYRLLAENDFVRILEARLAPGQKTRFHSHPDSGSIVLEPGTIQMTQKDKCRDCEKKKGGEQVCSIKDHTCPVGKSTEVTLHRRGEVVFHKADRHVTQNGGKTAVRSIIVEFKGLKAGDKFRLPSPHKRVGSNRHAVAYELNVAPGESVPEHTHGHHVIVSLANGQAEIVEGQKTVIRNFGKDTVTFAGPVTHSGKNIGKTPMHLIDIELK